MLNVNILIILFILIDYVKRKYFNNINYYYQL